MIFRIDPGQEKEILNKYFNLVGEVSPWPPASAATRRRSGGTPPHGCGRVPVLARIFLPLGAPASDS